MNDYRDYYGMEFYSVNDVEHHGILGMRWGRRRYQPYPDGSMRDASKAKYKDAKAEYKDAKNNYKKYRKSSIKTARDTEKLAKEYAKNKSVTLTDGKARVEHDQYGRVKSYSFNSNNKDEKQDGINPFTSSSDSNLKVKDKELAKRYKNMVDAGNKYRFDEANSTYSIDSKSKNESQKRLAAEAKAGNDAIKQYNDYIHEKTSLSKERALKEQSKTAKASMKAAKAEYKAENKAYNKQLKKAERYNDYVTYKATKKASKKAAKKATKKALKKMKRKGMI